MRSIARAPLLPVLLATLAACGGGDDPAGLPASESTADADADSAYGVAPSANVRVVPVEIEVPGLPAGWQGMRIAALSDFQIGAWRENEAVAAAAVRAAVGEDPDLVVLLGDYVDERADSTALDALARVVAPLRGRRALAVLGTEDAVDPPQGRADTIGARVARVLEGAGVDVLRNRVARVGRGGDTAYVVGLDPFVPRWPDWRRAETFAALPGGPATQLVLTHMPAAAAQAPDDRWPVWLAGNTFCGSVEVPGTPRLSWVNENIFPGVAESPDQRSYRIGRSALFVTCGTGYSFVPVRFGAAPEVALVTLLGLGGARGTPAADADTTGAPVSDSAAARTARADSIVRAYETEADTAGR